MQKRTAKTQVNVLAAVVVIIAIIAAAVAVRMLDTKPDKTSLSSEYIYNIDEYTKIDPTLIQYQSVGEPIDLDFESPRAIAIGNDGKLVVAGDQKIAVFAPDGSMSFKITLKVEPTCVYLQADQTMLVGALSQVLLLDTRGAETARYTLPVDNAVLTSIATDDENIFAADAVNKLVWRLNRQGEVVGKLGVKDPDRDIPGFVIPSPYFDILMAPDGLLRVVNPGRHVIAAYTVDGHREWDWGTASMGVEGFSGCCNPVALAILPDGGFVTAEKGLVRVKTYNADGEFVNVVAGPEQLEWKGPIKVCSTPAECGSNSFDVAVDVAGRIYVLDMENRVVRIYQKK